MGIHYTISASQELSLSLPKTWASGQDVLVAVPEQPRPYEEERRAMIT
jgi:hypothetical protein